MTAGPEPEVVPSGYSDLWVRAPDGSRLHGRSYGPLGSGALPIVCLPGLARHSADFHQLAVALSSSGQISRRIVAVDYRGRGLSDHDSDPSHYSVPVELDDLVALLSFLDIERAVFIGTSRGGLITMTLAASRPEMIAGAVLNDIGPRIELAGLLRIKGYVGKLSQPRNIRDAAERLRALFGPQFPNLTDADWAAWAEATWTERDGRLALGYDPALAKTLEPIERELNVPEIWPLFEALAKRPVLVVHGGLSDLLTAETVRRMSEYGPNVETLTVPDQGHTPLLHAPDVLARIRAFINRCDQDG